MVQLCVFDKCGQCAVGITNTEISADVMGEIRDGDWENANQIGFVDDTQSIIEASEENTDGINATTSAESISGSGGTVETQRNVHLIVVANTVVTSTANPKTPHV